MTNQLSEHEEQIKVCQWLKRHTNLKFFAIPNGELRHKTVASRLKAEGVTKGVPDLCIPALGPLWIEMKTEKGGRVSKDQKEWHEYLNVQIGQSAIVCEGHKKAIKVIKDYMIGFGHQWSEQDKFNKG